MNQPIHTCVTKAVVADGDQLESGPQWLTARRARLKLFDDHLECGDWSIPYEDIHEAVLTSFRSHILQIPGYVLAVRTDSKTYHFGLNGFRFWEGELPFPVRRTKARLRLSLFSFVMRAVVVGCIAYLVWEWLQSP